MNNSDKRIAVMTKARNAVLENLRRRAKAGDATVKEGGLDLVRRYPLESNYYSGSGMIPCPVCEKGMLKYSRASSNLHVMVACSTESCVRFME